MKMMQGSVFCSRIFCRMENRKRFFLDI